LAVYLNLKNQYFVKIAEGDLLAILLKRKSVQGAILN